MSSRKQKISSDKSLSSKATKTGAAVTAEVALILKRRDSWELSDDNANSAMALMKADGLTDEEMKDNLRVFLYAKGIMPDKDKMERTHAFNNLLNPDGAVVSDEARKKLWAARTTKVKSLRMVALTLTTSRRHQEQVFATIGSLISNLTEPQKSSHRLLSMI